MRKALAALAVVATCAVVGITASVAMAVDVSNPDKLCDTATGTWHFVHVQTSAASGTLTAVIGGVTYVVNDTPSPSPNLHYFITAGGTLSSASDNVADGKLVISDCPQPPPPPPPPPV